MARCRYCRSLILLGGKKERGLRFCSDKCHQQWGLQAVGSEVPDDIVEQYIERIHAGHCPRCGRQGTIGIRGSYTVWSIAYFTAWRSKTRICCRLCGFKSQLGGILFSLLFGWWGVPFGLIMTPIQIARNLAGMISTPNLSRSPTQLENLVRIDIAAKLAKGKQYAV